MDAISTDTILKKSLSGIKWTVILSIIALPLSYAITVILGRISPEALGLYGSVNIFISFVTTFILFGGSNLIIKFIPEIEKAKRQAFIISYILIVSLIAIFTTILILVYPLLLEYIFGKTFSLQLFYIFVIFIPIIIFYSIFDYVLNGLMEIRISAIVKKIVVFGNFLIFFILIVFNRDLFSQHFWGIIIGSFFVLYLLSALLVFVFAIKFMKIKFSEKTNYEMSNNQFWQNKFNISENFLKNIYFWLKSKIKYSKFYLPHKFWSFALFVHLATIVVFIYDTIDQLFIINFFGLYEYGLYFPALQTALLIRFIPILLGTILLPTFSNLLAKNEISLVQKAYHDIVKYNILMIVPLSLFCIFFSKQILGIFGEEYIQYRLVLVVLALCFMVCSMVGVNSAIILTRDRAGVLLCNSVIQVVYQLLVTFLLIAPFGIIGFAIGRGSSVILATLGTLIIIYKFTDIKLTIPREFFVSIFIAIIAALMYAVFQPSNFFISCVFFIICLFLFFYLSRYSLKDINFLIHRLVGGS